ncbi:2-dehydro-3-deoxy-D-gluconate 5-dehydrogenase [Polystyrenella longa]|uniref:2-dehydro-3-deoxy-D-gluconate 5-dehydrogenase n=1 Tax=Polystyrenella longa TaxID=2528007 RepID=A0A518CUJ3_9PLAN|nr:SDR family oxidoreductase [Polystyrenella longa]QDU82896.1 2-dehydro-3-deoxy-D-gluconate 5-dehydrogenase [Polystyrenella longa]
MNPFDLTGKIALVTGAGEGIGNGCALELAKAGADLVLNDRPGSTTLAAAAEEVRKLGRNCWPIEANVFERVGCEELISSAIEQAGQIDILVSNPAYSKRQPFLEYDPENFDKTIQGTLTSGFHMCQLFARHLVERKSPGKIILISSVQGRMPYKLSVAYNAAKAGLDHMARTIAVELFEHKINVNTIQPGWIETPGEHRVFGSDAIKEAAETLPWKRLGQPSDIGMAAVWLASAASDYVTGDNIKVDGGFVFKEC